MTQADDARRTATGPLDDGQDVGASLLAGMRAEADDRFGDAMQAFDRAVRGCSAQDGPGLWRAAAVIEQAARFHLRHGLGLSGQRLLARAIDAYRGCGAADEADLLVEQLEPTAPARTPHGDAADLADAVDPDRIVKDRQAVLAASRALADETDPERLLALVTETALSLCGAGNACLLLHDADRGWRRVVTSDATGSRLTPHHVLEGDATNDLQARVLRHAAACSVPEIVDDLRRDTRFIDAPVAYGRAPTSLLAMPIASISGHVGAVLVLWRRLVRGHFKQHHLHTLALLAGQFHVSIEHVAASRELERRVAETTRQWQRTAVELQLRNRALDALTQGVMIVDRRGGTAPLVCYVNRQFTQDSGYGLADMQRLGPGVLHGEDVRQPGLEALLRAVHGDTPGQALLRHYRKTGELFWCETSVAPVQPGVQLSIHTDVSGRVEADRLRRLNDERLRSVFDFSPDGFVVLDAQGRVSRVNPAFEALTGLSEAALAGFDADRFESRLATLCQPPRPGQPADHLRLNTRPPVILWRRVRQAAGGGLETLMFFRDITQDIESDRLKNEFLATAAHELRTPLTSVFGFSELLLARPMLPVAERREMLAIVHRQAGSLTRLIDELLELARIEARGRSGLDLRLQPLQPLVLRAAQQASGSSRLDGLDVRLPLEPIWMLLDAQRMMRALTQAVSNALRFGGDAPVIVSLDQPPGSMRLGIRIRDRGCGMSASQLSHLFDRFFRADPFAPSRGSGLGATLMKAIVELHGGQVTAASEIGIGTEITFWLDRPYGFRASTPRCPPA